MATEAGLCSLAISISGNRTCWQSLGCGSGETDSTDHSERTDSGAQLGGDLYSGDSRSFAIRFTTYVTGLDYGQLSASGRSNLTVRVLRACNQVA